MVENQDYTKSTLILDLTTGNHDKVGELIKPKKRPSCTLFNETLYLVGKGETELFSLKSKTWIQGPSFSNQMKSHPTLLKMKNQLFCFDSENLYELNPAEKWEPVESVRITKSEANFVPLPLAALILEDNSNIDNVCKFSTK